MENLYCIEKVRIDPIAEGNLGAITGKYDDKALTVLVWRSAEAARIYMTQNNCGADEFRVREFALKDFDRIDKWADSVGMNLFIHIVS